MSLCINYYYFLTRHLVDLLRLKTIEVFLYLTKHEIRCLDAVTLDVPKTNTKRNKNE